MSSAIDKRLITIKEIEFPLVFSPKNTSTPEGKKVIKNLSFLSSSSESEDGNITGRAIRGVDESLLERDSEKSVCENLSSLSLQTAIEYIDQSAFTPNKLSLSHESVKAALEICGSRMWPFEHRKNFIEIGFQRYLWDEHTTWKSHTLVENPLQLLEYLKTSGFSESYIMNSIGFTYYKILEVSEELVLSRDNVKKCFLPKGIPSTIIDRLFDGVVTKTKKDLLDVSDLAHFIFALYGADDEQSIEYWFRILDTDGLGYLDERNLKVHYDEIKCFLSSLGISTLEFAQVIEMYSDILGTDKWTLSVLKKSKDLTIRVLAAFINALKFCDYETNERNTEREDDEMFGQLRNCWRRTIDHGYHPFYDEKSLSNTLSPTL